jgi:hypothetical protein
MSRDKGIDGCIWFDEPLKGRGMALSVKGGNVTPADVRELPGSMHEENGYVLGGLICLEKPTKGMWQAVADAGMWRHGLFPYPRLQIRTIEDLFAKKGFHTPTPVQPLNWERQGQLAL